jgi:hypothetical protein
LISIPALRAVMRANDQNDPRYWAIRWQYLQGADGFYDLLMHAAAKADTKNRIILATVYPALMQGVVLWRGNPGWAKGVEAWAEALAVPAAPSEDET